MSSEPNNQFQTALGRARGLGSSKEGTHHWMHERITSITSIPLILWLVWSVVNMRGWDYLEFTAWLGQPLNAFLMILAVISTFYHAALGVQVIVEDYVHCHALRFCSLIGLNLAFLVAALSCLFSIIKIAFAG